jgi:hypothetical protein
LSDEGLSRLSHFETLLRLFEPSEPTPPVLLRLHFGRYSDGPCAPLLYNRPSCHSESRLECFPEYLVSQWRFLPSAKSRSLKSQVPSFAQLAVIEPRDPAIGPITSRPGLSSGPLSSNSFPSWLVRVSGTNNIQAPLLSRITRGSVHSGRLVIKCWAFCPWFFLFLSGFNLIH